MELIWGHQPSVGSYNLFVLHAYAPNDLLFCGYALPN